MKISRNLHSFTAGLALMALGTSSAHSAEATNTVPVEVKDKEVVVAPTSRDFSAFRLISERNIFNPNRSSRGTRPVRTERVRPRAETFSLVGTLISEKGAIAFFDGSGSSFKQALKVDDEIAGYKVLEVSPAKVRLKKEKEEQEVELLVGMGMRKEEEGEWALADSSESGRLLLTQSNSSSTDSPETASDSTDESSDPSNGSESEEDAAVRKLMEKRRKELNPE